MSVISTILIFSLIGSLGARQPDIDINRARLSPRDHVHPLSSLQRRSILPNTYKNHANDDNGIRLTHSRSPLHPIQHSTPDPKKTLKVYAPREDPRLFYQSDIYLKKVHEQHLNNEVSSIYPGHDAVRAGDDYRRSMPIRLKPRDVDNFISHDICIRCPADRTLIAKVGSDRVMLQHPHLTTCSGLKPPRGVRFKRMYGPQIGSLLSTGSHMMIGRVTYKAKTLQTCKLQINVVLQTCALPKYLTTHCDRNLTCKFSCRDPNTFLDGETSLTCGSDMKWMGTLPTCKGRSWCEHFEPPEHGRVSCKIPGDSTKPTEGSTCRLRCAQGYRPVRSVTKCRQGSWTRINTFRCQLRENDIVT